MKPATRQIVLDTETTGLDPKEHNIIEIGCVEIIERRLTGKTFHEYINPGRSIDEGAVAVHGITLADLADKPRFYEIADDLLEFLGDAEIVIHNAEFDMGFLEAEFRNCRRGADWPPPGKVIDSLKVARARHPNQRNSLDALCKRYEVDNSGRDLHGALLDAELLADVYLRLTGGQNSLTLDTGGGHTHVQRRVADVLAAAGGPLPVIAASAAELEAHAQVLDLLDSKAEGGAIWRALEASA